MDQEKFLYAKKLNEKIKKIESEIQNINNGNAYFISMLNTSYDFIPDFKEHIKKTSIEYLQNTLEELQKEFNDL